MKLVNETRLSVDESTKLVPVFNMDGAKESFDNFVGKGGYYGNWYKDGVDFDRAVDIVANDVLAGKKANDDTVDYGRQDLTDEQIAELKKPDLNAASLEAAMSMIAGTARSMGVTVEE